MNALAIAVQGLGYDAALLAMQGLLVFVAQEVQKAEDQAGGGIKTRRRVSTRPAWAPDPLPDDDEALLLIFGLV